ncbi:MAG TPA: hypothetical protein VFU02_19180, partial [Polyangiaceae bacterium]|nr:hypothetical protein [Polyangiaceae bacterium]
VEPVVLSAVPVVVIPPPAAPLPLEPWPPTELPATLPVDVPPPTLVSSDTPALRNLELHATTFASELAISRASATRVGPFGMAGARSSGSGVRACRAASAVPRPWLA